uniref:Hpt protein n=1 Tax=Solibacter usitatus (strain Ellin6076) TaxID=234267 RepID=Q023X3_SOLUE
MRVLDETAVLDRDQLRGITQDDTELMQELIGMLLDDTARQLRLLDVAIREHDQKQAMRLAHSCKGACANIGANAVASALKRLEQQAAREAFDECAATLTALDFELDRLRHEVNL